MRGQQLAIHQFLQSLSTAELFFLFLFLSLLTFLSTTKNDFKFFSFLLRGRLFCCPTAFLPNISRNLEGDLSGLALTFSSFSQTLLHSLLSRFSQLFQLKMIKEEQSISRRKRMPDHFSIGKL